MTARRILIALLFAALAPAAYAAPEQPVAIKDPVTVPVTVKLSDAQLRKAVRAALLNRGWKLDHDQPGALEAAYRRKDARHTYTARVAVTYDAQQIVVRYASSEGLSYDAAAKTILPLYNTWMDSLAKDFPVYLSLVTSE
jgi:hypothetical protein